MERSVTASVQFPFQRLNVMASLADIADVRWLRQTQAEGKVDYLSIALHVLYDDFIDLYDPEKSVGSTLVTGDEIDRLRDLNAVLGPVHHELKLRDALLYVDHPDWGEVAARAGLALAAMVRAWGIPIVGAT